MTRYKYSSDLTEAEQRIYDEIVNYGSSMAEIAKKFNVKRDTVNKQIYNIFIKKQVNSQKELIIQYYKDLIGNLYEKNAMDRANSNLL